MCIRINICVYLLKQKLIDMIHLVDNDWGAPCNQEEEIENDRSDELYEEEREQDDN